MSSRSDLIRDVRHAMRTLTTEIDALDRRAAGHFGVNRTDLHLIDTLRRRGPLTASQLAQAAGLSSGGLSIALDRLERAGYVHRGMHPGDRRSVVVEATPAVKPLEDAVFSELGRRLARLLTTYTDDQLTTIKDYLEHTADITRTTPISSNRKRRPPEQR
jgi:DNA-binding MarR family transcriptional regulator